MAILRQLDQDEKTIGDKTYVIIKLPATKGMRYQKILVKALKPVFSKMNELDDQGQEKGLTFIELVEIILDQLDSIDETVIKNLVMESTGMTSEAFEYGFSGNYVELFELVKEILFFNFGKVFSLLGLEGLAE